MWHLDYVVRFIHRAKTHTLILLDDCSRYVVGHGVDDTTLTLSIRPAPTYPERVSPRHFSTSCTGWSWSPVIPVEMVPSETGGDSLEPPPSDSCFALM